MACRARYLPATRSLSSTRKREREWRSSRLVVPFGRIFDVMDEIFDAGFRVI